MKLSVIVPDERPGMQRMLQQELQGIDSEIIYEQWPIGLSVAKGDFVCLLEWDSAVNRGAIRRQLQPFIDNPSYRKLAMVSPKVEFVDSAPMSLYLGVTSLEFLPTASSTSVHLVRAGCVPGAIIRRSSILKFSSVLLNEEVITNSLNLSLNFWEHGLRISHDPESIYYSPDAAYGEGSNGYEITQSVMRLWQQECVS